jgi:hypothetical protein
LDADNNIFINKIDARLRSVEAVVSRQSSEAMAVPSHPVSGGETHSKEQERKEDDGEAFVTRREMTAALERAEKRLAASVDQQFRTQAQAISSLRTLIADTDALLERVLERLESPAESPADAFAGGEEQLVTHGQPR